MLQQRLDRINTRIVEITPALSKAWEDMVAAKADRDPTHPLYKAWKAIDLKDSQLRETRSDLEFELECLED
jgi:hypothetical protein